MFQHAENYLMNCPRTGGRVIGALLLLLALVGRAEAALGSDREFWLRAYDGEPSVQMALRAWGGGVMEVMRLVVESHGCASPKMVSPRALLVVTADLLRERDTIHLPLSAAIEAYGRLSDCADAVDRWFKVTR